MTSAVSGYSGGGNPLIAVYEGAEHEPWGAYGFSLSHKHLPEMAAFSGLDRPPIFMPAVGDFAQGARAGRGGRATETFVNFLYTYTHSFTCHAAL